MTQERTMTNQRSLYDQTLDVLSNVMFPVVVFVHLGRV